MNFQNFFWRNNLACYLLARNWKLVTAESCTGGGLAYALTATPGSSRWFDRGFVTYSNESKQELLGVSFETLANFGPISYETITEMTQGALNHSHANAAISISGIAGPDRNDTRGDPVGTVWFGFGRENYSMAICQHFQGDRDSIRQQAIDFALLTSTDLLKRNTDKN